MKKRFGVWLMGILMLTCVFSLEARAADVRYSGEEKVEPIDGYSWVNPLYPEMAQETVDAPEIEEEFQPEGRAGIGSSSFQSVDGAAKTLRGQMVERKSAVWVYVQANGADPQTLMRTVMDKALAVDKSATGRQGDYLKWHLGSWSVVGGSAYSANGRITGYIFPYIMRFYTDKTQEAQVTAKVKRVLSSLKVSQKTSYGKVKAIYDYICKNVKYDYAGLNDSSYGKFTAYNALIHGRAVCQGYASLFYRMAMDAGVPARLIPGSSRGVPHAWNIVKLGNYYYNLDSTWDAVSRDYTYFLKSDGNFSDHTRDAGFATAAFKKAYPVSPKSYKATSVYSLSKAKVTGIKARTYTGKKLTQSPTLKLGGVTLKKDRDYTISYKNNVKVGTASIIFKGKGNYSGTLKKTFKITLKKGAVYTVGAYKYRVTNIGTNGKGAASLTGAVKKTAASVYVYNEVKIGGKALKVTAISANAFKNNKNLEKVSVGANVKSIGAQAFYGASKLKSIEIRGSKLNKVGAKTFYGIHNKAIIKVESGVYHKYKALLKNKGQSKSVAIRR